MSPAGALKNDEKRLIDKLKNEESIRHEEATLAVLLVTRKFYRTQSELLDLVVNYPGLENLETRKNALTQIVSKAWVNTVEGPNNTSPRLIPSKELKEIIGTFGAELSIDLNALAKDHVSLKILGHMGTADVYDTFTAQLQNAQSSIYLPMLSTSYKLEVIDILKERAKFGVHIKVLRATPKLVSKLRGNNTLEEATERRENWKTLAKTTNIEVRETRLPSDIRDASSMLVDGKILRYPVYDDSISRSTEGTMFEVSGAGPSNITKMYSERFEGIWNHASPLGTWEKITSGIPRWWRLILFFLLIVVGIALDFKYPTASDLVFAVAIGFLVNQIDRIALYFKKIKDKLLK